MAAHGRSTGANTIPIATQWLGQRLYYSLVQPIGYGYSIDTVWRLLKAYQVPMDHIDLLICIECLQTYTGFQR